MCRLKKLKFYGFLVHWILKSFMVKKALTAHFLCFHVLEVEQIHLLCRKLFLMSFGVVL